MISARLGIMEEILEVGNTDMRGLNPRAQRGLKEVEEVILRTKMTLISEACLQRCPKSSK